MVEQRKSAQELMQRHVALMDCTNNSVNRRVEFSVTHSSKFNKDITFTSRTSMAPKSINSSHNYSFPNESKLATK